jgi:hypothetical protein
MDHRLRLYLITLFVGTNILFNKMIVKKHVRKHLNKIKNKIKYKYSYKERTSPIIKKK